MPYSDPEKSREYAKKYREEHKQKISEYGKEWRKRQTSEYLKEKQRRNEEARKQRRLEANPAGYRWTRRRALYWSNQEEFPITKQSQIKSTEDRQAYNAYMRVKNKEYWHAMRDEIFTLLGEKCARCGFTDRRALQIDHVNGGGTKEMIENSRSSYRHYKNVLASIKNGDGKFQLLCANCNWIKRYENNEDNLP